MYSFLTQTIGILTCICAGSVFASSKAPLELKIVPGSFEVFGDGCKFANKTKPILSGKSNGEVVNVTFKFKVRGRPAISSDYTKGPGQTSEDSLVFSRCNMKLSVVNAAKQENGKARKFSLDFVKRQYGKYSWHLQNDEEPIAIVNSKIVLDIYSPTIKKVIGSVVSLVEPDIDASPGDVYDVLYEFNKGDPATPCVSHLDLVFNFTIVQAGTILKDIMPTFKSIVGMTKFPSLVAQATACHD